MKRMDRNDPWDFATLADEYDKAVARIAELESELDDLKRAALNFWGTCNPPMNEAQKRCEAALLAATPAPEGEDHE